MRSKSSTSLKCEVCSEAHSLMAFSRFEVFLTGDVTAGTEVLSVRLTYVRGLDFVVVPFVDVVEVLSSAALLLLVARA